MKTKKYSWTVLVAAALAVAPVLHSCQDNAEEIREIQNQVDDLKNRVDSIETAIKALNEDIQGIEDIVQNFKDEGYVKSIEPLDNGKKYHVVMSDGTEFDINLIAEDATASTLGIAQDANGYYWTVDGNPLMADGSKVYVGENLTKVGTGAEDQGRVYVLVNGKWEPTDTYLEGQGLIKEIRKDDEKKIVTIVFNDGEGGETEVQLPYYSSYKAILERLQSWVYVPVQANDTPQLANGEKATLYYKGNPAQAAKELVEDYASNLKIIVQTDGMTNQDEASVAPDNVTYDETKKLVVVTWTPTNLVGGKCAFAIEIDDETLTHYRTSYTTATIKNYPTAISIVGLSDQEKLLVGQTAQLSVVFTPAYTTETAVTWTTSDAKVATVSEDGLVKAIADGTCTITATAKDKDGKDVTATIEITVYSDGINTHDDTKVDQDQAEARSRR